MTKKLRKYDMEYKIQTAKLANIDRLWKYQNLADAMRTISEGERKTYHKL